MSQNLGPSPESSWTQGTGVSSSVTHSTSTSTCECCCVSSTSTKPRLAVLPESKPDAPPSPEPNQAPSNNDLCFTYIVATCGVWEEPPRGSQG